MSVVERSISPVGSETRLKGALDTHVVPQDGETEINDVDDVIALSAPAQISQTQFSESQLSNHIIPENERVYTFYGVTSALELRSYAYARSQAQNITDSDAPDSFKQALSDRIEGTQNLLGFDRLSDYEISALMWSLDAREGVEYKVEDLPRENSPHK